MFSAIPCTVNMQHGTVSQSKKIKSGSDISEDDVCHLPQMPDTPLAGNSHWHKVTFSPVMRPRLVSSTPHLVPQPESFNLTGIPNTETSGNDTDSEAEGRPNVGTRSGLTPYHQKRTRQDASITMHSLQLAAEEFQKIPKLKIQKMKADIQPMPCLSSTLG